MCFKRFNTSYSSLKHTNPYSNWKSLEKGTSYSLLIHDLKVQTSSDWLPSLPREQWSSLTSYPSSQWAFADTAIQQWMQRRLNVSHCHWTALQHPGQEEQLHSLLTPLQSSGQSSSVPSSACCMIHNWECTHTEEATCILLAKQK